MLVIEYIIVNAYTNVAVFLSEIVKVFLITPHPDDLQPVKILFLQNNLLPNYSKSIFIILVSVLCFFP